MNIKKQGKRLHCTFTPHGHGNMGEGQLGFFSRCCTAPMGARVMASPSSMVGEVSPCSGMWGCRKAGSKAEGPGWEGH